MAPFRPSLVLALVWLSIGCATTAPREVASEDEIVDVPQTVVERRSIGASWLYAHASWVESMHEAATGEDFDVSRSYWTYWHWYDQIVGRSPAKISTGGNWTTANGIVKKYGVLSEADFVVAGTTAEPSARQAQALAAVDASLRDGALSTAAARRDRRLVRRELDRAFGLSAEVVAMLDRVFGEDVSRTFSSAAPADPGGTPIARAADFSVAYTTGPHMPLAPRTLSNAMSEWRPAYYPTSGRRAWLARVQRALHDAQPVVVTWFVDFNAMETRDVPLKGSFNMTTLRELGPGRQGGHMTVLEDYQAKLPDGTVLEAGVTRDPQNPEDAMKLERALDPASEIAFFRVKNAWGAARPDRAVAPGMPGHHDLYVDYLDGPVKRCVTGADGETDTTNCPFDHTPLQNVVLPPGY